MNIGVCEIDWSEYPPVALLMSVDETGNKKWTAIGSAFPAIIDERYMYLITAAHCVRGMGGMPVYAILGGRMISLAHHFIHLNVELDVAAIAIPLRTIDDLFETRLIVGAERSWLPIIGEEAYRVFGFPAAKNKMVKGRPFNRHAFGITLGRAGSLRGAETQLKASLGDLIIREIDPENMVDDRGKRTSTISRFEGMSGGPIIRFAERNGRFAGLVVGVFVEWHKAPKVAVGIHWNSVECWLNKLVGKMRSMSVLMGGVEL